MWGSAVVQPISSHSSPHVVCVLCCARSLSLRCALAVRPGCSPAGSPLGASRARCLRLAVLAPLARIRIRGSPACGRPAEPAPGPLALYLGPLGY